MPSFDVASARRWDVVVLPFPYSDRLAEKRRPALVISDESLHKQYGLRARIGDAENCWSTSSSRWPVFMPKRS